MTSPPRHPRKVLHILNGASGGAVLSTIGLIKSLEDQGISSCAVCHPAGTDFERRRLVEACRGEAIFTPLYWWNIKTRHPIYLRPALEARQLLRTGGMVRSTWMVERAVKIWQADLIHTNTMLTPEGGVVARRLGIPHVWHVRELIGPGKPFRFRTEGRALGTYLQERASKVIANSRATAAQIANWLPPGLLEVVPNGIALDQFLDLQRPRRDKLVVAMVAGLEARCQWLGEPLADIPTDKNGLPDQFYIARAYKRLADAVHERFACVYTINTQISKPELDNVLNYFPAVWIWTLPYSKDYLGNMVAEECRLHKRAFTGSVFCDFYTSKLQKPGTWDMYRSASEATAAGINNVERKYITTGLSYNFRKLFEFGIKQDVPIINVITWNDYPEGHHLAPEINHNEGFSILLNYYKSKWKKLPSPYANRDVAIAFFKKYKHNIEPKPFNIPVKSFQQETIPAAWEDSIEVVTLLKAKGRLTVNGQSVSVGTGLVSTKFKMSHGPVKVSVTRGGIITVKFSTPEGITDHPYRTDRLTYTYSSEFGRFYKNLYNGFTPGYSYEYNPGFIHLK